MANRAAGKGYENEAFYDNIKFQFFGIENIHVMRASLQKLVESKYFRFFFCFIGPMFRTSLKYGFLLIIWKFAINSHIDGPENSDNERIFEFTRIIGLA